MQQKDRNGNLIEKQDSQQKALKFLYGTTFGRLLLKPLTCPCISKAVGWFLSTKASRIFIRSFIRKHGIDMQQFAETEFHDYNAFFCRKIRPELRPVDREKQHFISPCDSKLTVLPISPDTRFTLKHTEYSVASLLKNDALAAQYTGGWAMIFRLTVDDYHRYGFLDDGVCERGVKLPGALHTVNPIANDYFPIYKENSREYCLFHTENFSDVVMMEVGALLVGKIVNHTTGPVQRGQEKGYFQFGGSTVVALVKADIVRPDDDILQNSAEGVETVVKYGQKIGVRL